MTKLKESFQGFSIICVIEQLKLSAMSTENVFFYKKKLLKTCLLNRLFLQNHIDRKQKVYTIVFSANISVPPIP